MALAADNEIARKMGPLDAGRDVFSIVLVELPTYLASFFLFFTSVVYVECFQSIGPEQKNGRIWRESKMTS